MKRRAVFLDRDGVLNRNHLVAGKPIAAGNISELKIVPGARAACDELHRAGYVLLVVTNQPDVARGNLTSDDVRAINDKVREATGVDAVYVCDHDDADGCDCRKPKPGLLTRAAQEWDVDLSRSVMIGDRGRDIEAGRRAGCRSILVDGGHQEPVTIQPDASVPSLVEAAAFIVSQHETHSRPLQPLS